MDEKCDGCECFATCQLTESLIALADKWKAEYEEWKKEHAHLFLPKPCLECDTPIKSGAFCSSACEKKYREIPKAAGVN